MPEEKESVLKRIQKLLQMSIENGASENEAMLAADKAQKLLQEHNLSISDLKDEDQVEPMDSEDVEVERDLWKGYIRGATAKLYFCKTYTTMKLDKHYRRVKIITFVGRKSNRMVATEMCKYFINTVDRLAAEEFREVPGSRASINKMSHAFKQGCASRLQRRLLDRYNEIAPEYIPQGNPDGLPVLYKNEQMAITKWLEQKGIRLVSRKQSMSIRDRVAYSRGSEKANGIGLNTQVNARTKSRMLGR
ncbi:hypothetical protein [uncultured virus]|uniref:Uncharacterized protein n=1 Tax=uncultured virus TaxID=340016 RepID=A0A218MKJ6_9VIRU|nr:hypothetical protein [uncultured virus]